MKSLSVILLVFLVLGHNVISTNGGVLFDAVKLSRESSPELQQEETSMLDRPLNVVQIVVNEINEGRRNKEVILRKRDLKSQLKKIREQLQKGFKNETILDDLGKFQISMEVVGFALSEITVKTVDGAIVVNGEHDKNEPGSITARHIKTSYPLPKDVDANNITSSISSDGLLIISAPKYSSGKNVNIENKGERSIPIIQTGTPAVKPAEKTGQ